MSLIKLEHKIKNDKYTEYVYEAFDIQDKEKTTVKIENNLNIDFDFNIGVIYGGSGEGKSTLLKTFGEIPNPKFPEDKSLISCFDFLEPRQAGELLAAMGLSSIPTWLRPFHTLSNGEQYRASLAYCVGKAKPGEMILVDEYTSVVDRAVAKAMSNALAKYVRRNNKKIVLASCHFDIMDWLCPDWIYSPNKRRIERFDSPRQRPAIELQVFRCKYDCWKIFKQHHYLTEDLNKAAKCFVTMWDNKPVAFNAILPFPHGSLQNAFRMSRSVVLPDYQGLGIGGKLMDYFAALYKKDGKSFYYKASNPALWAQSEKTGLWSRVSDNTNVEKIRKTNARLKKNSIEQTGYEAAGMKLFKESITRSYKYIGPESLDSTDVITFNKAAYEDVAQNQGSLFD